MVITQNQVLSEIGVTLEKNVKSLDDLLTELTRENTLLNFIVNSEVYVPCFPLAHMTLNDREKLSDAYEGKGHQAYYEAIMQFIESTIEEENNSNDEYDDNDELLTRKDKKSKKSKKSKTVDSEFSALPSPISNGVLPNLDVLNKLDYTNSCTKETNCVLLRRYGSKLYGRPCPVLIFKFLNYISIYQKYSFDYLRTMDPSKYETPDDIEPYQLAMIITNARIKTFDDFNLSTSDNIMTVSKDGLQVSKNTDSKPDFSIDSKIYSNFKTIGIDILELNKIQLRNQLKKTANTDSANILVSSSIPKIDSILSDQISITVIEHDDD